MRRFFITVFLVLLYSNTAYPSDTVVKDTCKFNLETIDKMQNRMFEIKAMFAKVEKGVEGNDAALVHVRDFLHIIDMPLEALKRVRGPVEYYNKNFQQMDNFDRKIVNGFIVIAARSVTKDLKSYLYITDMQLEKGASAPFEADDANMKFILETLIGAIGKELTLKKQCYTD